MIDVVFRSEKNCISFDTSERGSVDDDNANMRTAITTDDDVDMRTVTHDRSPV